MRRLSYEILEPDIIERVRGGYLAVSKRSLAVRLGAMGDTEQQARAAFAELVDSWLRARKAEQAAAGNAAEASQPKNDKKPAR